MKFNQIINEEHSVRDVQDSLMGLWSRLVAAEKAHPTDEGLFHEFKSFYYSFLRKHNKKPLFKDAIAFIHTNT